MRFRRILADAEVRFLEVPGGSGRLGQVLEGSGADNHVRFLEGSGADAEARFRKFSVQRLGQVPDSSGGHTWVGQVPEGSGAVK